MVLLFYGLDKSSREVAGHGTLLVEHITEIAVAERLAACRPWVRALLLRLLGRPVLEALPPQRRILVIDGSGVQASGVRGTQYRLHLCMELVTLTFVSATIIDKYTGESLRHFPLGPGDVVVADRGYGHPATSVQTVQQGADVLLRLNPHNVPVTHGDGTPVDWRAVLERLPAAPVSTLPVQLAMMGTNRVRLWVHAAPLPRHRRTKPGASVDNRAARKGISSGLRCCCLQAGSWW